MTALAECEQAADSSLISFALFNLSIPYIYKGAVDEAIQWSRRGLDIAPTPNDRAWCQLFYGWAMIPRSPTEAIALLAPLIPIWLGRWNLDTVALVALGEAYFMADQLDQARATLERAIDVSQSRDMLFMAAPAQRLLGEVFLAMNLLDESEVRFQQAIELLERFKAENEIALARAGYGRVLQRLGRIAEARDCFDRALESFERLGTLNQSEKLRDYIAVLAVE